MNDFKFRKYFLQKRTRFLILFLVIFLFVVKYDLVVFAAELTSTNFIIRDPIVGTGGGYGSSSSFQLISAGHNILSGVGSSTSFLTRYGFLYYEDEEDPTITFDIDVTSADTCSTTESGTPYTVALGTITTGDTKVSGATDSINSICLDLDTNASSGAVVTVFNENGANGLASSSVPADNINSIDGSVANGTENYGLCIVSTSATTGTLDDEGGYNADTCAVNSETNNVQALSTVGENIFDTNGAAIVGGRGQVSVQSSISSTTPAHNDYRDTVTFIATSTF
ncbi:MAG: hypothetical protein AAB510_01955 [Patescibacteria group bacterium]